MQPADDMEFGGAFANALLRALVNFIEGIGVGPGSTGIASEGAQLAVGYADIGRVDVPIDVEVGDSAVALFSNVIGQPANRQEIRRPVQRNPVINAEAVTREYSLGDGLKPVVGNGQF